MQPNPFSPTFATHPDRFYGRKQYLARFETALDTPNSAARCFFLTGTRGCGKTSLLHQYVIAARNRKWDVIEATSSDAYDQLLHYVGLDRESTVSLAVAPAVKVAQVADVSAGSASVSSTSHTSSSLLTPRLRDKLRSLKLKQGLLIAIDEAQKINREYVVAIGNAVQGARSEGLNIALVFGGLPSAYAKIRGYKDCTFLRRMPREELWCMPKSETIQCMTSLFSKVREIQLSESQIFEISRFSGGQPYLMQLVGDALYRRVAEEYDPLPSMRVSPTEEDVAAAEERALIAYKRDVIDDVMAGTHGNTREYVAIAWELRDEQGLVRVADINAKLGGTVASLAARRTYAINTQVIRSAGRGYLRFALPHFELAFEDLQDEGEAPSDDEWEF